ncbi:MAG TPA: hypothetical protein VM345_15975 [Acidimicrobiales bacterium]|jgi:hypothetical protein|nr:hypothetical protein [Acidimicrobiales bacterium]
MAAPTPVPDPATVRRISRRLWNLIEPIASSVYFVPEVQAAYADLGLDDYGTSYFASRGACMGQVPGQVVAAAFGVFNPSIVVPAVERAWSKTTAADLVAARLRGQTAALRRIFDEAGVTPSDEQLRRATTIFWDAATAVAGSHEGFAGRPLFAGLYALGLPGDGGLGDFWRAADVLREHRGDSHVAAWVAMRMSAVEVTLLTELWWGGRAGRYIRTRGWDDTAIAAGIASLQDRGFLTRDDEPQFTSAGEEVRAVLEEMTDQGETLVVASIAPHADELFAILEPLAAAVVAAGGYPRDPASLPRQ